MIICHICANANGLTAKPVPGPFSCENEGCDASGLNNGYEVESMNDEQKSKAFVAHDGWTDRVLQKLGLLTKRGLKEEPKS